MAAQAFDVEAYITTPFGPQPPLEPAPQLQPQTQAVLDYVQRCFDTAEWLSRVLVTYTHKNPRVTAFLATWSYERYWLKASLSTLTGQRINVIPRGQLSRRFGPLWAAVLANFQGERATALQMSQQFYDTLLLKALLAQAADGADTATSGRLMELSSVLQHHADFFGAEATALLERVAGAQHFTRYRLRHITFPLNAHAADHASIKSGPMLLDALTQLRALPGLKHLRPRYSPGFSPAQVAE